MASITDVNVCNLALAHLGQRQISSLADTTDPLSVACNLLYDDTRESILRSHRWNFAMKREILGLDYTMTDTVSDYTPPEPFTGGTGSATGVIVSQALNAAGVNVIRLRGIAVGSVIVGETITGGTSSIADQVTILPVAPVFGWSYDYALPTDLLRFASINDQEFNNWLSDHGTIEANRLLTNTLDPEIRYIRNETDVTLFDPIFIEALSLKLGAKLAEIIKGTTEKSAQLTQAYESLIGPLARSIDANEGRRRKGLPVSSSHLVASRYTNIDPTGIELTGDFTQSMP